jgi:hypothetical protein
VSDVVGSRACIAWVTDHMDLGFKGTVAHDRHEQLLFPTSRQACGGMAPLVECSRRPDGAARKHGLRDGDDGASCGDHADRRRGARAACFKINGSTGVARRTATVGGRLAATKRAVSSRHR